MEVVILRSVCKILGGTEPCVLKKLSSTSNSLITMAVIRSANIIDADKISRLVSSTARDHIGPTLGESGLETLLCSMDLYSTRQRLDDGWPSFCALKDGNLVGVVVVRPPSHLYHLFVSTDFQGNGIGRALFEVADGRAIELAGIPLQTVNSSLNVVAVYEQFGFVPQGQVSEIDGVKFQPMVRNAMTRTETS